MGPQCAAMADTLTPRSACQNIGVPPTKILATPELELLKPIKEHDGIISMNSVCFLQKNPSDSSVVNLSGDVLCGCWQRERYLAITQYFSA